MIFDYKLPDRNELRHAIARSYRSDETRSVDSLLKSATLPRDLRRGIGERARDLVTEVRKRPKKGGLENFMLEYGLSTQEGTALMCLAESLLRVPDSRTEDNLIEDKIIPADWTRHLGHSDSLFVNASSWAFMLTGKLLSAKESHEHNLRTVLKKTLATSSEPLIREVLVRSMRILGKQFIMGRTIEEALQHAQDLVRDGYRLSFDMLGEAARTELDADLFYTRYSSAIKTLAEWGTAFPPQGHEISAKLSALDPRYEFAQYERVMDTLLSRLRSLAIEAKKADIGLTLDAEECERLELQLDLLEKLACDPALAEWDGLGIAVQTYQKRAFPLLDWLADLAQRSGKRLMVRLTKGAYWDTEIKHSQEGGFDGYPVFTRKVSTDISYIACARKLLKYSDRLYPMFATHNAYTAAMILELAGEYRDFELQRLFGMGESLYECIRQTEDQAPPCRIYAPCGGHKELLPYLVRRLLENGANTSFVNRILDESVPVERITADPLDQIERYIDIPNPLIPLPSRLFGSQRTNSRGMDLSDENTLRTLAGQMQLHAERGWKATSVINGKQLPGIPVPLFDPSDRRRRTGLVTSASDEDVDRAVSSALAGFDDWNNTPVVERAACLMRAAELLESNTPELLALCIREAGKTLANAVAEIREAVDFCRYYAEQARREFLTPHPLTESGDRIEHQGHGAFACISPWNFPLAIFSGQVAAALVTGNTVVAKPAEQTPLIAFRAVQLFHQAGIPRGALQLVIGDGYVGARLVANPGIAGVAFTGSTQAARSIRAALANGRTEIAPLIAETGGQNAMIVDSTALPDQVVVDVLKSAFDSAGQRCSALRVLCLQEDIADQTIDLLAGAMQELRIGDPALLKTDVGPVIDPEALGRLQGHDAYMRQSARLIHRCRFTPETEHGNFFAPCAYEIDSLERLDEEHFGPFLHVLRYRSKDLDKLIDAINATGYGLTFGLHSRIDATVDRIRARLRAGNIYVNRNMIGAVVGVQPFGGEGLSGTGPKAGGPHYLYHFSAQRRSPSDPYESTSARSADSASHAIHRNWSAAPVIGGKTYSVDPAQGDAKRDVGIVTSATPEQLEQAMRLSAAILLDWDMTPATTRAVLLERVAVRLYEEADTMKALCLEEYGASPEQTAHDIDRAATLCRGYAEQCIQEYAAPRILPGPTGERNAYSLHNRGIFLCVGAEPQPVIGLTAMIAAALAAGNPVILMPEQQSVFCAAKVFSCFHASGFADNGLHFLPADNASMDRLLQDPRLGGVAHLGSPEMACHIDAELAKRKGPIIPLVASIRHRREGGLIANPRNLYRFSTQRTLTINTTASGGNASLYAMDE